MKKKYSLYLVSYFILFCLSITCNLTAVATGKTSYEQSYSHSLADWGPNIDVVGFCFLDLASSYEPPDSLVSWLEAGEKPIYIGFGSLVSFCSIYSYLCLGFTISAENYDT